MVVWGVHKWCVVLPGVGVGEGERRIGDGSSADAKGLNQIPNAVVLAKKYHRSYRFFPLVPTQEWVRTSLKYT